MLDANGKQIIIKVGGSDFEPIPSDKYETQIVSVTAKEEPNTFKGGALELKLNFQFVLLDPKKELKPGVSLRGRYLWKRTSISLNPKSWLFKLYKGVIGREPSVDEMAKFDPESLVGQRVAVMVEQSPSKDGSRIFSNIISFSKATNKGWDGKELEDFDYEAAKAKQTERTSQAIPAASKDDNSVSEYELDELFSDDKSAKKTK
jgi:hypothetical protein